MPYSVAPDKMVREGGKGGGWEDGEREEEGGGRVRGPGKEG